jgi:hypothetical protein
MGNRRDGSFDYYISEKITENDGKGVGPFILAGIEISKINVTNVNRIKSQHIKKYNLRPTSSNASIDISVSTPTNVSYKVFDLSGTLLSSNEFTANPAIQNYTISHSLKTKGLYLHTLYVNNTVIYSTLNSN